MILFLLWQAFVVVGLLGWGFLVRRLLSTRTPAGAAADLVAGITAFGAVAATFMLVTDLRPFVWVGLLGVGCVATATRWSARFRARHDGEPAFDRRVAGASCLALGVTAVVAATNVFHRSWNTCDDGPAYLYLARRAWSEGNLADAFNNRRLTSAGLFSALQGVAMGPLGESALHAADEFIGAVLLLTLLWRRRDGAFSVPGAVLAILVVATHERLGASNASPVLVTMAMLLHCLDPRSWFSDDAAVGRSGAVQLGLGASALTMIRPQFGLVVAGAFVGYQAFRWFGARRDAVERVAWMLGVATAAAVPWSALQWRDSGTWLFPFGAGNLDPAFPFRGYVERVEPWAYLGRAAQSIVGWIGVAVVAAAVAGLWAVARRADPPSDDPESSPAAGVFRVVAVVGGVGFAMAFAFSMRRAGLPSDWPRFWTPVLAATVLAAALPLLVGVPTTGRARRWRLGLGAVFFVMIGATVSPFARVPAAAGRVIDTWSGSHPTRVDVGNYEKPGAAYERVSDRVPAGSTVLSAVDLPHLLLGPDRRLVTADIAAATSPEPHFPYDGSYRRKVEWLRSHGIDHVVVQTSGGACLYKQPFWRRRAGDDNTYADWAPFVLEWTRFTDAITVDAEFTSGDLALVDVDDL